LYNFLRIVQNWAVPFQQIAPYLIKKFGKDLSGKLVRSEDLVETYGKEALDIWKLLLEKGS